MVLTYEAAKCLHVTVDVMTLLVSILVMLYITPKTKGHRGCSGSAMII